MVFIGNTGEDAGKWIEAKNLHKKRPLVMGSFMVLQNKVLPCFHFSVKPLLHTFTDYVIKFFFVEGLMECYLTVTCVKFPFRDINNKKTLDREGGIIGDWRVKCFLSCLIPWEKVSNFYSINY